jgi:hypothetical protein
MALAVQPAWAQATQGSPGGASQSKTKAAVACTRLRHNLIRCRMAIKGAGAISGTVAMRITQGKVVVALGSGRITRGQAALTMRVRRRMSRGRDTVTMVMTITASTVLRLP